MLLKLLTLHAIVPALLLPVVAIAIAADHVAVLRAQSTPARTAEKPKPAPAKSMRVGPCF